MVFLEDPLTADPTTRWQTEEDEELAQQLTDQYTAKPTIEVGTEAATLQSRTVVYLVGPAAALLSATLFQQAKAAGSVSVPELQRLRSPYAEEYGMPVAVHSSAVLQLGSGPVIVTSERLLPPEQAVAWAAAVAGALLPAQLVIAGTIPAMDYRGPGDPADEDLIFSLQTPAAASNPSSSKGASALTLPPELPSGTLLTGLPAALLSLADRQALPATAVVGVQLGPAPDAAFVLSLAAAVQAALGGLGEDVVGQVVGGAELAAAVRTATDCVYRSSASNSIFI